MAVLKAGTTLYHRGKKTIKKITDEQMWLSESPKWLREDTDGYGDFIHTLKVVKDVKVFDPLESAEDYDLLMKRLEDAESLLKEWIELNLDSYYFPSGAYSELGRDFLSGYDGYKEGEDGYYSNFSLYTPKGEVVIIDVFDCTTEDGKARLNELCDADTPDLACDYIDWYDQYDNEANEYTHDWINDE